MRQPRPAFASGTACRERYNANGDRIGGHPRPGEAIMKDWRTVKTDKKMVLGRYIVADPKVCGGRLTFRGTRVYVADVLEQVAKGMDCVSISKSWGWTLRVEAIEE